MCSARIIQEAEKSAPGIKVFNMNVLDAQLHGNQLAMLVKLVSGRNDENELTENIVAYIWGFSSTSIAAGNLIPSQPIVLSSLIIKDISIIRVARIFPSFDQGLAVIDREDSHELFLYDSNRVCAQKELLTDIYVRIPDIMR